VLVKVLLMAHALREEVRALSVRADAMYEDVVSLAVAVHGDPSLIVKEEE